MLDGAIDSSKTWLASPGDFSSIAVWLQSLASGYRGFLDHYGILNEEPVLYATAAAENVVFPVLSP